MNRLYATLATVSVGFGVVLLGAPAVNGSSPQPSPEMVQESPSVRPSPSVRSSPASTRPSPANVRPSPKPSPVSPRPSPKPSRTPTPVPSPSPSPRSTYLEKLAAPTRPSNAVKPSGGKVLEAYTAPEPTPTGQRQYLEAELPATGAGTSAVIGVPLLLFAVRAYVRSQRLRTGPRR